MNIHEYQAKQLLLRPGIPLPIGRPALTLHEADQSIDAVMSMTGKEVVVVKAQIHAGGRGKGGGVKVARGKQAAHQAAQKLLGLRLTTHQTGPKGKLVKRLLIEEGVDIVREFYVAVV